MTFELLKVCQQANPTWIDLQVMYVRSTVMDRHARWAIINQKLLYLKNRIIFSFFFFISFCLLFFPPIFFISVYFVLLSLVSFHFVDFVSFRFVFVDFVSFRFYFVSHFIGTLYILHKLY